MRLNAYLARTGIASRRGADELIKRGRVRVNGVRGELNTFVEEGDVVDLDGRLLVPQALAYVLLHKPAGVVTTASDPHGRPTVVGLVEHESRVLPVGRLDADTTGASCSRTTETSRTGLRILATRSRRSTRLKSKANRPTRPSPNLADGVDLDDGRTAPARVHRLGPSRIELSIHEGRKHQVKRMLEAVGHPVQPFIAAVTPGSRSTTSRPGSGAS